jgi:hypothetical protein
MAVDVRLYCFVSLLVQSGVIAFVFNGGSRRGDPWRINGAEAHYGSCLIVVFPLEQEPVYPFVKLIGGHFVIPCTIKG